MNTKRTERGAAFWLGVLILAIVVTVFGMVLMQVLFQSELR